MDIYQGKVDAWIRDNGGYWDPWRMMGRITEELGELSKAIRKGSKEQIREEFGDMMFTLVALANRHGVDLDRQLLDDTLDKYSQRDGGE